MKSKEQKRREAVDRLERQPRWCGIGPEPEGWTQRIWAARLEQAQRLRKSFGLL